MHSTLVLILLVMLHKNHAILAGTFGLSTIALFYKKAYNNFANRRTLQLLVYNPYINYLYSPENACRMVLPNSRRFHLKNYHL